VKIKLDENLSRHLKDALSQLGHDVATAVEEGLLGKVDTEVGAAAKGEDRMIFTLDLILQIYESLRLDHIPESSCLGRAVWDHSRLIALS
jgi:predicted nuclease of predicted toxin-antitoxin system